MKATVVALAMLVALPARADDSLDVQRMKFVERGEDLTVDASITKLFDSASLQADEVKNSRYHRSDHPGGGNRRN